MRKVLVLLLIAALFLCGFGMTEKKKDEVSTETIQAVKDRLEQKELDWEEEMARVRREEWPAQEAYERLLSFLNNEGNAYMKYYGGAFLNDNKELEICLTSFSEKVVNAILNAASFSKTLITPCRFSYDELNAAYDLLREKQEDKPFPYLSGFRIMVQDNCVEVNFSEESETIKREFKDWAGKQLAEIVKIGPCTRTKLTTRTIYHY